LIFGGVRAKSVWKLEIKNVRKSPKKPAGVSADKTRKNAIVEYLDYQIPVTQLNEDMQAAKRD